MIIDQIPKGGGGGQTIQVDVLPVASADELGHVYQYLGITTSGYTHGYFYECVENGGAYSWENVQVQDDESGTTIVQPPTVTIGTYTYDGTAQGPTIAWATGMADNCIVTNVTATNAGTYTLIIALKNTAKMVWTDMTTADKTYSYTIAKQTLTVPTVDETELVYDGTAQSPTITGFDPDTMTKSGDTETDAGSYTVTFGLVDSDNYEWSSSPTSFSWAIAKANQILTLSETAVTLDADNLTADVTVSGNQGTISATSSNTSNATVSVSGTTVTISRVGSIDSADATVTVTVTAASTTNYKSVSDTVTVTVTYLKKVSWAAATIDEIKAMVKAADEGRIDLYEDCGWRVGQEKIVSLPAIAASGTYSGQSWTVGESQSAQSVTLVLMHKGLYELVNPVKDKSGASRSTCSFAVGLKDCLVTIGYMNSSNTNTGSWDSSARRAWCNGGFRGAMESIFGTGIFKQFKTKTISDYNGSSIQTSNDYFALPAAAEVFKGDSSYGQGGTVGAQTAYSNLTEFNALTRFTYYETTANRVKKFGSSGSTGFWWERSPNGTKNFCYVNSGGQASRGNPSYNYGLAPFGCL